MKKVLFALFVTVSVLLTGCATLGQNGGSYRDNTLTDANRAPSKLTPPDLVSGNGSPVMDATYLSSQADYHFTMGETLSFEGQSARAIEEYKSTLIYDPKSVQVRMRLSAEYVHMGMMTEAVEQAETAVQMAPDNIDARMLLGGLYMNLKMFDQAKQQFEVILEKDPGHPEAAVYVGALMAEQQKYEESVKYFEILAKNPKFKEPEKAYFYIGRVRSEQGKGKLKEAKEAFTKALQKKSEYPEAAYQLAMLLRGEGKEKEMETVLRSYQEKFGPEREMARQLGRYYLEHEDFDRALEQLEVVDGFERDNLNIKIQIALILIEQKKYEDAAQRLEDVLHQAPDSDKVRYYLGAVYEEIGRPTLAIEHYSKITPGSTYFAEATIHTAHLYKTTGKLDVAVETMEKAIKAQDDVPQLYSYYATLLDEQREFKKAVKMLSAAVERFPTNTQLRFFFGTMEDRVGNSQETIVQMNKVLEQDKDHVQALNYLAYTYAETGNHLDQAAELASHALSLQPNDGYILDTMGWIRFKLGKLDEAIKFLELAVKARPDEAIIAEHLGDAYLRHQMWQKAQKSYQKAAQMESDLGRSQKIQEKIANIRSQSQQTGRSPASE